MPHKKFPRNPLNLKILGGPATCGLTRILLCFCVIFMKKYRKSALLDLKIESKSQSAQNFSCWACYEIKSTHKQQQPRHESVDCVVREALTALCVKQLREGPNTSQLRGAGG
jgi:hypothetical protein